MVKVKICGITNIDDALAAAEYGADAIGFVFWEKSPRNINRDSARSIIRGLPPFISTVGVFVNATPEHIGHVIDETGINCVQLHGEENPDVSGKVSRHGAGLKVIKALRIKSADDLKSMDAFGVSAFLLDSFREGVQGGTGETFDWEIALNAKRHGRIILSGGLTPETVSTAIKKAGPWGVDVSSGVELKPGKKDHKKIQMFIEAARRA